MTKAGNGGESPSPSPRACFVQSFLDKRRERQPELLTGPPEGQIPTLRWALLLALTPAPQEPVLGRGDIPFCMPSQQGPPDHTAPWTTLPSNHTASGKASQNEGEGPGWARC